MTTTGADLHEFLVRVMRQKGDVKYARNVDNRNALLKAIFDFNNCMARLGGQNLISQAEVTQAVINKPEPEEIEPQ